VREGHAALVVHAQVPERLLGHRVGGEQGGPDRDALQRVEALEQDPLLRRLLVHLGGEVDRPALVGVEEPDRSDLRLEPELAREAVRAVRSIDHRDPEAPRGSVGDPGVEVARAVARRPPRDLFARLGGDARGVADVDERAVLALDVHILPVDEDAGQEPGLLHALALERELAAERAAFIVEGDGLVPEPVEHRHRSIGGDRDVLRRAQPKVARRLGLAVDPVAHDPAVDLVEHIDSPLGVVSEAHRPYRVALEGAVMAQLILGRSTPWRKKDHPASATFVLQRVNRSAHDRGRRPPCSPARRRSAIVNYRLCRGNSGCRRPMARGSTALPGQDTHACCGNQKENRYPTFVH
jgi:hypothetical protein